MKMRSLLGNSSKHVSMATNKHAAVEELLEVVSPIWSVPVLCSKDPSVKACGAVGE